MRIKTKLIRRLSVCMLFLMITTICIITTYAYQTDQNTTIHNQSTQDEIDTTYPVIEKKIATETLKDISTVETEPKISKTIAISETQETTVVQEKVEENNDTIEQTEQIIVQTTNPVENLSKPETTLPAPTEPNENNIETVSLGTFTLTAYCPCSICCGKWSEFGLTSTGTIPEEGRTIAVDPNVIPYGTEVIINGHTYIAEDCGSAIKENRIDIFFNNHNDALIFGIQTAEVKIVKNFT